MKNGKSTGDVTEQKLTTIIGLLQQLVALKLARQGVKQQKIAKHLCVATATVTAMLDSIKKEKHANA